MSEPDRVQREMTLAEYVYALPSYHAAFKEWIDLQALLAEAALYVEKNYPDISSFGPARGSLLARLRAAGGRKG